jgi:glycerophosphoryl diester phosphodiesterase
MGHRGARFEAPENTIPGFRYAVGLGLAAVEFDVRLTADEAVVVIHDDTVDRTTNGEGRVADLTLSEIRALDARSTFPEWPEACTVPTLSEVLEVVGQLPTIEIEIKRDAPERLERLVPMVVEEIRRRGLESQVRITSFEPRALELAQRLAPEIRRRYIGDWDDPHYLETAIRLGCSRAGVHHPKAKHDVVTAARGRGLEIVCWPTNSQADLESALSFAPHIICTDNPTLIRQLSSRV